MTACRGRGNGLSRQNHLLVGRLDGSDPTPITASDAGKRWIPDLRGFPRPVPVARPAGDGLAYAVEKRLALAERLPTGTSLFAIPVREGA